MTQIQWLVENNRNKVAAIRLLIADLTKRIEKLEEEMVLEKIVPFPTHWKN